MSYENLHVYQAAEELRAEVDRLAKSLDPRFKDLFRHVDEAIDSIANNIAEGGSSIYPARRINYYDIAAGSAREACRGLRSLDRRGAFNGATAFRPIVLTLTIQKMLKALIEKERRALAEQPSSSKPNAKPVRRSSSKL